MNTDTQGDLRALQLENARLARLLEEARTAHMAGAEAARSAEAEARVAALQEQLQQVCVCVCVCVF